MVYIKFIKGSIPLLSISVHHNKMKGVKMIKELAEIESKIEELKRRKQEILDEEKNRKEAERDKREEEVQTAYEEFLKVLRAFEEDYDAHIRISYDTSLDSPVRFKAW
jgi:uncharacterized protein YsxB (DUF464 family)